MLLVIMIKTNSVVKKKSIVIRRLFFTLTCCCKRKYTRDVRSWGGQLIAFTRESWNEFSQGHIQNSTEWWFLLSWVKVSGCNNIIIIQDHVSITLELWRYTRWCKKRPLLRSLSLYQFQTINQINALRKKLKISYSDSNVWSFELKIADFFSSFLQRYSGKNNTNREQSN